MANFHLNSKDFLDKLTFDPSTDIILEIGSDRDEGSTEWFSALADKENVGFYTVDVVDVAKKRFSYLDNVNWVIDTGSSWTKNELPKLGKKIKVLYLDNYDWVNPGPEQEKIVFEYAARNVEWSNLGSQMEHLHQMVNCLPYMSEQSVIICDDTILIDHSGTYSGKCGPVIPYLLIHGYKIVYGVNNGIILTKGV